MSPSAADFEARVAALAGDVPVALLPVRLEARFVADELRVRIFPDQIHRDKHYLDTVEEIWQGLKQYVD